MKIFSFLRAFMTSRFGEGEGDGERRICIFWERWIT